MLRLHKSISFSLLIIGGFIILFIVGNNKIDKRKQYEQFLQKEHNELYVLSDEALKDAPKPTHPDKAAIQNYFMTLDPNEKRVPTERLKTALNKTNEIQKSSRFKDVSSDISWEEIPSNMAGRVRAMMFDPNDINQSKVWAGTATGGLWYNNDINNVNSPWQAAGDLWASLAVSSLASDPNNSQVFYAGTGEPQTALTIYRESSGVGVGIYKTEDGGANWTLLPSTQDFKYITNIVVKDLGSSSVIYAGVVSGFYKGSAHQSTPTDGLYRSADGGNTWEQVLPNIIGANVPYAPSDVKISADGKIFVGTMKNLNNDGGSTILYSESGDVGSWTIFDDYEGIIEGQVGNNIPGRVVLATAPSDANRVYAVLDAGFYSNFDNLYRSEGAFILRTSDGGTNWTAVSNPNTISRHWAAIGWHALCVAVHPDDEDQVFVGGLDCYKSSNAGNSWSQISYWSTSNSYQWIHADIHNYVFNPANPNQILVSTDGGIFMSSNSYASIPNFAERNNSFNCLQFYTCAIDPREGQVLYIGGLQDNGSVYYSGQAINSNMMISGGDGAYCFIDQDNPNTIITSVYHNIYYFNNTVGNRLGSNRDYYNNGSGTFINPADLDDNLNILYANATGFKNQYANRLIRYNNITSNFESGDSFITITSNVSVPFSHLKVSPHTSSSSTLFVGTESGRLFKVLNANSSPSSNEIGDDDFPTGYISCVDIGGSEDSLLVTFSNYGVSSIWQTYDGGSSWEEKEGNLPDMPVRWALYHPDNATKALIATELGVWYTDQLDQASPEWIPVVDGLSNVRVDMLDMRDNDHKVLAATHGRGLATSIFGPVGIKDDIERESDKIILNENPTDGQFNLKFDALSPALASIKIFDLQGRVVFNEEVGEIQSFFNKDINIDYVANGQYIIHFKFGNTIYTKKLIKY